MKFVIRRGTSVLLTPYDLCLRRETTRPTKLLSGLHYFHRTGILSLNETGATSRGPESSTVSVPSQMSNTGTSQPDPRRVVGPVPRRPFAGCSTCLASMRSWSRVQLSGPGTLARSQVCRTPNGASAERHRTEVNSCPCGYFPVLKSMDDLEGELVWLG
jgi:hypothetical protein